VIDDNEQIGVMLIRGLTAQGYDVEVAHDGFSGRAAWRDGVFDLVLLDVMLPQIDGISLCEQRRAEGDTTPVVMLTGRDEPALRRRALDAGASDLILKPFAYGDLVSRIDELLHSADR